MQKCLFILLHSPATSPRSLYWWDFYICDRLATMHVVTSRLRDRLVGLVVKASPSRAEDPGFESRLRRDLSGIESYQWLQNWHSSGYPARCLALWGQCWDWLARCQYTVTGWDGKLDLHLLSVAARKIEQNRPWDTLACCWDVKQPTKPITVEEGCEKM